MALSNAGERRVETRYIVILVLGEYQNAKTRLTVANQPPSLGPRCASHYDLVCTRRDYYNLGDRCDANNNAMKSYYYVAHYYYEVVSEGPLLIRNEISYESTCDD